MSFIAVAVGGSALVGAYSANKAAKSQTAAANKATDAQEAAAEKSIALQRDIYNTTNERFEPYLNAGNNALSTYSRNVGDSFQQSPGYKFGLQGGVDAITAAGSVAGGVQSGATQKALTQFGQDYATGEYNNWLNRVGGLMSSGQNAAGQQAAAGQNFATGASNAYADQGNAIAQGAYAAGNAQSAGAIGMGNAIQGGISNGLSLYQYQNSLTKPTQYAPQTSMVPPANPYY